MITLADVEAAAKRLSGRVLRTPTVSSQAISDATGAEVVLKLENLQVTGAFKERGAANRLALLTDGERARGVIAMSAGNHAQAVARHAKLLGRAGDDRHAEIHAGDQSDPHRRLGRRGGAAWRDAGRGRRARPAPRGNPAADFRPSL